MKKTLIGPAKNFKIGKELLDIGVDELYAGLSNWSLRSPCFEMTFEDIVNLHLCAKSCGKILRVCLNTYPWEHDLKHFDYEIQRLNKAGLRKLVLADIASIIHVKRSFPDMIIQASVACDVRNIADAKVLEDSGAKSITLSYPSHDFVKRIKTETDLDVVIFAHGYFNYTYRSKCYMSSYLHHSYIVGSSDRQNASGSFNREGYCNRACKCFWTLRSNNDVIDNVTMNSYPFVIIKDIIILLDSGADALKIQGRENSDDLIISAIQLYRSILDKYIHEPKILAITPEILQKALDIDKRRHRQMQGRTEIMIKDMLGVDQKPQKQKYYE